MRVVRILFEWIMIILRIVDLRNCWLPFLDIKNIPSHKQTHFYQVRVQKRRTPQMIARNRLLCTAVYPYIGI